MGNATLYAILGSSIIGGAIIVIVIIFLRFVIFPKKEGVLKQYIKSRNYSGAISVAKEILRKNPGNIEARYYLGEAFYYTNKLDLALTEYGYVEKSGLYEKIDEKNLREKLAAIYQSVGELERSLQEYILLTQQHPHSHILWFKAAEIAEELNKKSIALEYYTKSVKINKEYKPSLIKFGMFLLRVKKLKEAGQLFKQVIKLEPYNVPGNFYLGVLEKELGNYEGAALHLEKTVSSQEFGLKTLLQLGDIYVKQNNPDEAIRSLKTALKNSADNFETKIEIQYLLAEAYSVKKDLGEAVALWEEITRARPGYKDVEEKLKNYQGIGEISMLKKFYVAQGQDFADLCQTIAENMNLKVINSEIINRDRVELLCIEQDDKWKNMRKKSLMICVVRTDDIIPESDVRRQLDRMREKQAFKCIMITSSSFAPGALGYIKGRSMDVIDKSKLNDILQEKPKDPALEE